MQDTGKKIKKWRDKLGRKKQGLYLAQLVRMQEEIGTGGGGFRYIYAAFLQEALRFFPKRMNYWKFQNVYSSPATYGALPQYRLQVFIKAGSAARPILMQMGDYLIEISEIEKKAFQGISKNKMVKWIKHAISIREPRFSLSRPIKTLF